MIIKYPEIEMMKIAYTLCNSTNESKIGKWETFIWSLVLCVKLQILLTLTLTLDITFQNLVSISLLDGFDHSSVDCFNFDSGRIARMEWKIQKYRFIAPTFGCTTSVCIYSVIFVITLSVINPSVKNFVGKNFRR